MLYLTHLTIRQEQHLLGGQTPAASSPATPAGFGESVLQQTHTQRLCVYVVAIWGAAIAPARSGDAGPPLVVVSAAMMRVHIGACVCVCM